MEIQSQSSPFFQKIKEVIKESFPSSKLQENIAKAEEIACCILKKIENQATHKLKLVCSKQKCPFHIKLEFSSLEKKYFLKDTVSDHNHSICQSKFEEKMLTSRLLKYTDFIYNTYFLADTEIWSKPKLILKDLKTNHSLDLFAGNYTHGQKQKLKKKFDNIIQQLRQKQIRKGTGQLLPTPIISKPIPDHIEAVSPLPNSVLLPLLQKASGNITTPRMNHSESTVKLINNRISSNSISNFDQQTQETMQSSSLNLIPSPLPFNLLVHSLRSQQQKQQLSDNLLEKVVSEEHLSDNQCKVEDEGSFSPSLQKQNIKLANNSPTTFQVFNNPTLQNNNNNVLSLLQQSLQYQQQQKCALLNSFDLNSFPKNTSQMTLSDQHHFLMKLQENHLFQEQYKQEEMKLKAIQFHIQQQQQQQQFQYQQILNSLAPLLQQTMNFNSSSSLSNQQSLFNIQMYLQNQQQGAINNFFQGQNLPSFIENSISSPLGTSSLIHPALALTSLTSTTPQTSQQNYSLSDCHEKSG